MYGYQDVRFTRPAAHPLLALAAMWSRAARRQHSRDAARQKCGAGRLSQALRHDIGEVDCRARPRPQPAEERQQTLEAIWLRYF